MKEIYESYFPVANEKKAEAKLAYHNDPKLGSGRRHNQGRTDAHISAKDLTLQLDTMLEIMAGKFWESEQRTIGR